MLKKASILLFVISTIVFVALISTRSEMYASYSDEQILLEANRLVPRSDLPEFKPPFTDELMQIQKLCTKVPRTDPNNPGFDFKCIEVPQAIIPDPEELEEAKSEWRTLVQLIEEQRAELVRLKAKKISEEQAALRATVINEWIQIAGSILGMVFGLVGTILALRQDRRESKAS